MNTNAGAGDKFSTALSLECSKGLIEPNFVEIDIPDYVASVRRSWLTSVLIQKQQRGRQTFAIINSG